jgi:hypothetical protein
MLLCYRTYKSKIFKISEKKFHMESSIKKKKKKVHEVIFYFKICLFYYTQCLLQMVKNE